MTTNYYHNTGAVLNIGTVSGSVESPVSIKYFLDVQNSDASIWKKYFCATATLLLLFIGMAFSKMIMDWIQIFSCKISVCEPKMLLYDQKADLSNCNLLPGQHIRQGYPNLAAFPGRAVTECCSLCRSTAGCEAYSWNNDSGGTCYLKPSVTPIAPDPNVQSGVIVRCNSLPGQHIRQGYPNLAAFPGRAVTECCSLCRITAGCNAYSWNNDFGGTCYLKPSATPISPDPNVQSGILNGCN